MNYEMDGKVAIVHQLARMDFAVDDHRTLDNLVRSDDRHFGTVDHRRCGDTAQRSERRQGQCRS